MGAYDYLKLGDFNRTCDRTGFKVKASHTTEEWTGNIVRTQSWEERHPQDLIRSIPDRQDVPDARPEQTDSFLAVGDVSASDL